MEYYIAVITEDKDFFSMENHGEQPNLPESSAAKPDEHFLAVEVFENYAGVEEAHYEGNDNHFVIIDCDLPYLQDLTDAGDPSGNHGLTMTLLQIHDQMMANMPGTVLATCGGGKRNDDGLLADYVPHFDKTEGVKAIMGQISELIDELEENQQAPDLTDDFDPQLS